MLQIYIQCQILQKLVEVCTAETATKRTDDNFWTAVLSVNTGSIGLLSDIALTFCSHNISAGSHSTVALTFRPDYSRHEFVNFSIGYRCYFFLAIIIYAAINHRNIIIIIYSFIKNSKISLDKMRTRTGQKGTKCSNNCRMETLGNFSFTFVWKL